MHRLIEPPPSDRAAASVRRRLLDEFRNDRWEGELSSSALAAAVAVFALYRTDAAKHGIPIRRGLDWLVRHANPDGGWGDSPRSLSNLSTTLLCWSVFRAFGDDPSYRAPIGGAERWIRSRVGGLGPDAIARSVLSYYREDRTFSAPILALCALAGRLGPEPDCWEHVPQLPMELAILPHRLFKRLRLSVVSYALPVLIAIGLIRHDRAPSRCPVKRTLRNRWTRRLLDILEGMQPGNGGFLEATPLTSFVVMSLSSAGFRDHAVARRGIRFILGSQREDGGWPIDTNLATWVTTLAVKALSVNDGMEALSGEEKDGIRSWLLSQQFRREHPFTRSAPGGWSWTDLPGGVPDADDTSGALLALKLLGPVDEKTRAAAADGVRWLLDLQNRDGGIPTFCRGWGRLPFDRSCADITAHAFRAFTVWREEFDESMQRRIGRGVRGCLRFLRNAQRKDGSWIPLWFGNEATENQENPTYGTAQVLTALNSDTPGDRDRTAPMKDRAVRWLMSNQNIDGGWGSRGGVPSTMEETALALSALAPSSGCGKLRRGVDWLRDRADRCETGDASPIGLYFAGLWYYEKLYPHVFSLHALEMHRPGKSPTETVKKSVASGAWIM